MRAKVRGSAERPRLAVFRWKTAASRRSSSTTTRARRSRRRPILALAKSFKGDKTAQAEAVGKALAASAKQAGVEKCVFDRGGYLYQDA